MARRPLGRLALDQDFPTPILAALSTSSPTPSWSRWRRIDPRLSSLDDRELIIALHLLGYPRSLPVGRRAE
jgi:hypothetical protein